MKFTKRLMTAGATACLLIAPLATAHETDDDKGPKVEKSYDFTDFTGVVVTGVYDVEIKVGPSYSIELEGKEKRMKYVEVEKSGDTLFLGMDEDGQGKRWNGHNNGIRAVITLPALDEVSLTGVGAIEASGIKAGRFVSELEGVGSIELSGTCDTLEGSVAGIGSLDASDLECKNVEVDVEGMGSAEVYASESVDADIDGMGSIDVEGSPKDVKKSKSMMSSISIR